MLSSYSRRAISVFARSKLGDDLNSRASVSCRPGSSRHQCRIDENQSTDDLGKVVLFAAVSPKSSAFGAEPTPKTSDRGLAQAIIIWRASSVISYSSDARVRHGTVGLTCRSATCTRARPEPQHYRPPRGDLYKGPPVVVGVVGRDRLLFALRTVGVSFIRREAWWFTPSCKGVTVPLDGRRTEQPGDNYWRSSNWPVIYALSWWTRGLAE